MPSAKYALDFSSDRFSNGSTAIDLLLIDVAVVVDAGRSHRSVTSSTTAKASTAMMAKSSLRPVCRAIDASGGTSLSRFNPSGVSS